MALPEPEPLANEGWFNNRWRPTMAWLWFTVSACDFILFPILNGVAAALKLIPYAPWQPITLQGGGLFHMAMGGVVGVATWQRTQEKLAMYRSSGGDSTITEHTVERTSTSTNPQAAPAPAKVDIKTDTVQVNTNTDATTKTNADVTEPTKSNRAD